MMRYPRPWNGSVGGCPGGAPSAPAASHRAVSGAIPQMVSGAGSGAATPAGGRGGSVLGGGQAWFRAWSAQKSSSQPFIQRGPPNLGSSAQCWYWQRMAHSRTGAPGTRSRSGGVMCTNLPHEPQRSHQSPIWNWAWHVAHLHTPFLSSGSRVTCPRSPPLRPSSAGPPAAPSARPCSCVEHVTEHGVGAQVRL